MSYLQLADNPYSHLAGGDARELYVFVPAGFEGAQQDMYIREDKFDSLPDNEYQILMSKLAPYQPSGLSGKGKDRRAKKQADKDARRKQRMDAKQKRVETRSSAFSSILNKAGDVVGGILGKQPVNVDASTGGLDVSYSTEPSFWEKYKTPVLIGGALVVGGVIYMSTRKKGKR